jgi:signal transduction histidine kinase
MIDPEMLQIPTGRESQDVILLEREKLNTELFIDKLLNILPVNIAVINEKRQVLFVNKSFYDTLNVKSSEEFIGKLPGEALNCVNADKSQDGCGASPQCKFCIAINTIIECQMTNKSITNNVLFRLKDNLNEKIVELKLTAMPFLFENRNLMLLMLQDISELNRQKMMERMFFHDVMNTTGALINAFELMSDDPALHLDLIPLLGNAARMLYDEINAQKIMTLAESNELKVNPVSFDLYDSINYLVDLLSKHSVSKDKRIVLLKDTNVKIITDRTILERIVINLLKNALEASDKGMTIFVNYGFNHSNFFISVENETIINEEIKSQMFKKRVSTKGELRGVGTYSIKLLTEQFLKGTVTFQSDILRGTVFTITIPLKFAE